MNTLFLYHVKLQNKVSKQLDKKYFQDLTICKQRFWKFSEEGLEQTADDIEVPPFLQRKHTGDSVTPYLLSHYSASLRSYFAHRLSALYYHLGLERSSRVRFDHPKDHQEKG